MNRLALVIEDFAMLREEIVETLQDAGWAVVEAATWEEARCSWVLHAGELGLVVTDNNFPRERGGFAKPQASRVVRLIDNACPVVVHSGDDLSPEFADMPNVRFVQKGMSGGASLMAAIADLTGEVAS